MAYGPRTFVLLQAVLKQAPPNAPPADGCDLGMVDGQGVTASQGAASQESQPHQRTPQMASKETKIFDLKPNKSVKSGKPEISQCSHLAGPQKETLEMRNYNFQLYI